MTSKSPTVIQLDTDASTLLDLLVELGHLDDRLLATINDRLLDLDTPSGVVSLEDVRRIVAAVVFESMEELDLEFLRMIESEWGLLFH